ncbi:hypothetical protein G7066_13750 [Leucobacter coleopterorum]|uniref:Secreted protein n=1 Tax=Leucobacter coleopterorum TaxID=2714933 RepID=A0ABX6JTD2_9MICO|nr:hypothetical protein [Leucobacter coleopterorum]QIM17493.1 hypothetical protein G7066_13750 [Leucobacter coleopterorum]
MLGALTVCLVLLGMLNTDLTEAVIEAIDLPCNVASSTYSGVRSTAALGTVRVHLRCAAFCRMTNIR